MSTRSEQRFDIVAKFDKASVYSAQAVGQLADLQFRRRLGPAFSGRQGRARRQRPDDDRPRERQTPAHGPYRHRRSGPERASPTRPRSSSRTRSSRQGRRGKYKSLPPGYRVRVHRHVPEPAARALAHFMIVLPITILLLLGMLLFTFKSLKFEGHRLASHVVCRSRLSRRRDRGSKVRGTWIWNVSTCVGFAALFGVSIMDSVLMLPPRSRPWRPRGFAKRPAILHGALGSPSADPLGIAGRHARPVAGVAGHRPRLGRAASTGDGHRVGAVQL